MALRLIGIDPGLTHTGWGVIDQDAGRVRFVACGRISPPTDQSLAERLRFLHHALTGLIETHSPTAAAIEETVVNVNAASSLKLGHARGIALVVAALGGLSVHEYASKRVKRALVGTGAADKRQVQTMVRHLLPTATKLNPDAADALAVALCHSHHAQTAARIVEVPAPKRSRRSPTAPYGARP